VNSPTVSGGNGGSGNGGEITLLVSVHVWSN
jgi:hypothetical protein